MPLDPATFHRVRVVYTDGEIQVIPHSDAANAAATYRSMIHRKDVHTVEGPFNPEQWKARQAKLLEETRMADQLKANDNG